LGGLHRLICVISTTAAQEPQVEQDDVVLYRAVGHNELEQIMDTGTYTVPTGLVGKYFYPTREQAQAFILAGWAEAVTSAPFPADVLAEADVLFPGGEGQALYLPATAFPHGPVIREPVD
jgi:hypothetical protein